MNPAAHQKPASAPMHGGLGNEPPAQRAIPRHCRQPGCGRVFKPKRGNQTFCSPACRNFFFGSARKIGVALIEARRRGLSWAAEALQRLEGELPDGQGREK
jgi:hypothetical protein